MYQRVVFHFGYKEGEYGWFLGAIRSSADIMKEYITHDHQPCERVIGNNNHMINHFQEMMPSKFSGITNFMAAESWVMQLEEIFGFIGYMDYQHISLAMFMMKGEAKHWWNTMRDSLVGQYDEPLTQEAFLEVFKDYYFPPSVHEEEELEFLKLLYGSLIVLQYKA